MDSNKIIEVRKVSQQYAFHALQLHEAIARKAGFAGTDHKYVDFFLQKGSLTAGELATLTGLTTGAVTGLIDRLEKRDLVKRQYDNADRRKVLVVADTQKISALLEPFYQQFQQETDNLIGTFSQEEMEVIATYLRKSIVLMAETKDKCNQ